MSHQLPNRVRVIVLFVSAILLPVVILAQWGTSSNNLYNTNSGNVGIGNSSPEQKLDVLGNALVTGGIISKGSGAALYTFDRSTTGYAALYRTGGVNLLWDDTAGDVIAFDSTGNVGIGTTSPSTALHVVGDVTVTGNISAKYQDIAEWVPSSQILPTGSVVVLAHGNSVVSSTSPYDTKVAGVVSETPGIVLGEAGEGKAKIATTGRVKVRVDATAAPIEVGDLLVTSSKVGMAMKSEPLDVGGAKIHRPGTLIGKALEPLESGEGEILILLSLQ